uniref:Uncharacterized protein n=1 Tax=Pseudomonas phage KV2023 TaxID=3234047 RepID=A0AB39C6X0_9CAUD
MGFNLGPQGLLLASLLPSTETGDMPCSTSTKVPELLPVP